MLIKASATKGFSVVASDGSLGTVSDLLFDDASWTVRWLVVETGSWFADRRVLLPASALGRLDLTAQTFAVRLTMDQVKHSPDVDTHLPVSRQFETSAHDYYGLDPYWSSGVYLGGYGYWGGMLPLPPPVDAQQLEDEIIRRRHQDDDPNLRSVDEISGYHIHATDGEIGHLADVLIDDSDWSLRYLIVNTSNWWAGKEVLISPRSTEAIRWTEHLVYLGVDRDKVRNGPEYDPTRPLDPAFDAEMTRHYGPQEPVTVT